MHDLNVDNERFRVFVEATAKPYLGYIEKLKNDALTDGVPIITDATRDVLKLLLEIKKPKRILELGTAIGYSTIFMSEYTKESTHIDTIENFPKRVKVAKKNIMSYDKNKKITLYDIDAVNFLIKKTKNIKAKDKYDFIFLDAAKAQYVIWLPMLIKLLKKNGILMADNILRDGDILESRYTIRKRDRTIHKRMREYIYAICHDKNLDSYILDVGDGLTVSVKK